MTDPILTRLLGRRDNGAKAVDLGRMAYREWLGALPGEACYRAEALSAYARAVPLARAVPSVAVFCDLLVASTRMPPQPLDLALSAPTRRSRRSAAS